MKASFLLIALALLAACSDDKPAQPAAATPPAVAKPAPVSQPSAPQQADMAAAEIAKNPPASDPCSLKGYDLSKMTVELHEQRVKECQKSKQ